EGEGDGDLDDGEGDRRADRRPDAEEGDDPQPDVDDAGVDPPGDVDTEEALDGRREVDRDDQRAEVRDQRVVEEVDPARHESPAGPDAAGDIGVIAARRGQVP